MIHQKQLARLFLFAALLLCFSSFAQKLQLEDLLTIYHSDSTAVKQFCTDKKFILKQTRDAGASTSLRFEAADSSKTSVEVIFPKDTSTHNVQLNYKFGDKRAYNNFKKTFRKNGFTKAGGKQPQAPFSAHAERYINKNIQLEFIRSDAKPPYWIFLHPTGEFSW